MKPTFALFPVLTVALLLANAPVHASSKMDNRIEASAKKSYVFKNYLKGDDIKIQSRDGVVTVSGNARNAAEKDLVTKLASDVNEVKIVRNRMTVTGSR
jgi:osmotically-inducible protein OsmY